MATGKRIWRREDVTSLPALDVNAEGTLLALGDSEARGRTRSWWTPPPATTVHTLRGHRDLVRDIRFSPDGSLVGSVSDDGELIVWDTATGRPLERWDTFDPWGVGFSPDNDLVYGGGGDSMLRTWDLSVEDTYLQQTTQVGDAEVFAHADLSPDGQQVAYSWLDDRARDGSGSSTPSPAKRRRPRASRCQGVPWPAAPGIPRVGQYVAYCVCCSRVRRGAAVVVVLDPATGKVLEEREPFDGDVYLDRRTSTGAAACSWATPTAGPTSSTPRPCVPEGDALRALPRTVCHPDRGREHRDGLRVSGDGTSVHWRVIDVSTGDVLSEGDLDLVAYASVASPDGSTVAVAGDTGEIVTIDVSTGDEQRRSTGLGAEVLWLDYSDDGELLVSGADDGGVSLWDATTLDLLGTVYPPHQGEPVPAGAQFIGDSHDVAIASYDGKRLPVGDRPRPGHRLRVPDGRPEPDRRGVGGVPARPALPVRLPRRVRGGPVPASTLVSAIGSAHRVRLQTVLVNGCEEGPAGSLHHVRGRRSDRYPAAGHLYLELDFADGLASRADRVCAERDDSRRHPCGL